MPCTFPLTPLAPAVYLGYQPGYLHLPGFDLYQLTEDIPGHPKDSNVSGDTLRKLGYALPNHRRESRVGE